jgi:hypothetical protein
MSPLDGNGRGRAQLPTRFLGPAVILVAAAAATAPILLHGPFCGDDFEFHVGSWFDAQQSWLHGIPYPHWMASANYGAGEPRFMFYPPLTWMLGAALGFVLPWGLVPIALVFLFLAGTGLAVRALAREALPDGAATLAGCAALMSGFALFTAYERTAFAELTGGIWIPLLLLFALRDRRPTASLFGRALDGSTLPLALMLAGCWLSDGPVGVMASYLLAAVALAASVSTRSWAHILRATIAVALGIALPAFYLIPAAFEQRWADLRAAVDYPVFNIENNWLFAQHTDPMLAPFALVLHRASLVAVSMISVTLVCLLFLFLQKRFSTECGLGLARRGWWIPLALIPFLALFMQIPASLFIWDLLPELHFLQYPWRWVLAVEAPMAIFFAAAVWPARSAAHWQRIAVAAFCTVFLLTMTVLSAKTFLRVCRSGDTVAGLLVAYRTDGGLEGTDEYEPPDADHWKLASGLPDGCLVANSDAVLGAAGVGEKSPVWRAEQGSCQATATAQSRQPEYMRIRAVAARSGFMILRLVSYPAWQITVNGRVTAPADPRDDGLIAVPVPQGPVEVKADWITTSDVVAGRCVSGLALLLLAGLGFAERKLSRQQKRVSAAVVGYS